MKMTLEQRAYYEYGKAVKALRIFKLDFCWREETLAEFYSDLVLSAWKKRAVLRITCSECQTYNVELKDSFKNIWCPYAEIYTNGKSRCVGCPFFEPRKEDV